MNAPPDPFNALCIELRTCVANSGQNTRSSRPTAELLAQEMPFSHRVGFPRVFVDRLSLPEPFRLEPKIRDTRRDQIGTGNCVFLWLGASAIESPPFVIFIDPILDEDRPLMAAPWDTGGLRTKDSVGQQQSAHHARALVERYTLPAPLYRHYLAEILHMCFEDPFDYIRGHWPSDCYPGRGSLPFSPGSSPAARTFEARHEGPLVLEGYILSVVFNPSALASEDARIDRSRLITLRRWCRTNNILLKESTDNSLFPDIIAEAERLINERGVL